MLELLMAEEAVYSTRLSHKQPCECDLCRGTVAEALEWYFVAKLRDEQETKPKGARRATKK